MAKISIYTDGACRGNPGQGAWAFITIDSNNKIKHKDSGIDRQTTNNRMEYEALYQAIKWIAANKASVPNLKIKHYTDSELLARQMSGEYRTKNPILRQIKFNIERLISNINADFKSVSRPRNFQLVEQCDHMCNQKLDNPPP